MGAAHVVCNVFAKADGLDGSTSEIASTDEAATEIEQDFGRPRTLGVAGVPEGCEQPLCNMSVLYS